MNLNPEWRSILQRAWSVRLMLLSGALSAAEVVVPILFVDMPRGQFAALSGAVTAAALVARIVAQKGT